MMLGLSVDRYRPKILEVILARVTVEDCLEQVNDQFALVHLAALRYRQLHRGADRLCESKNKNIVTALREIAAAKVQFREELPQVVLKASSEAQNQELGQPIYSEDDFDTPLI